MTFRKWGRMIYQSFDQFAAAEREQATQHMPGDYEQVVPFYRGLIEQFHVADPWVNAL
jgi:hypothetical protein